ncbi:hypothetical protein [Limosilactobacillus walteri]|uniref:Peptidase S74 domain-containing protein n=1 Tax=Limosilactobacillus walteri TaxID=2268022 RepID=A0ABR8P835_9LACO|nr:hypothetical protein [Limosilactobacillus walteri]MBD5806886.1 hypothetical protein [Limosilactobacillus walteri]
MKTVIMYGNDGSFINSKLVDNNYQLGQNETFQVPNSDLYNPKFNGTAWVGISRPEFDKLTINQELVSDDPSLKGMVQQLGTAVAQMSIALTNIEQQLKTNGGNANGQA